MEDSAAGATAELSNSLPSEASNPRASESSRKRKRQDSLTTLSNSLLQDLSTLRDAAATQLDAATSANDDADLALQTLVLASMHGSSGVANNVKSEPSRNLGASHNLVAVPADKAPDPASKKRKLSQHSSDDELDEEEAEESDEGVTEYAEDDEDDDFLPTTRSAAKRSAANGISGADADAELLSSQDTGIFSVVETRKRRHRTTPEQLRILEGAYRHERMPSLELREKLASQLGMTPRRVQIWFQNKRAKDKRARMSLRLQQQLNGKPIHPERAAQRVPEQSGDMDSSKQAPANMRIPGPMMVPVRTADGKVAYAAVAPPPMGQPLSPQQMLSVFGSPIPGVQFATSPAFPGQPRPPQGLAPNTGAQPAMYFNPMVAMAGARFPGNFFPWPGADPAAMQFWQSHIAQQAQLAAASRMIPQGSTAAQVPIQQQHLQQLQQAQMKQHAQQAQLQQALQLAMMRQAPPAGPNPVASISSILQAGSVMLDSSSSTPPISEKSDSTSHIKDTSDRAPTQSSVQEASVSSQIRAGEDKIPNSTLPAPSPAPLEAPIENQTLS